MSRRSTNPLLYMVAATGLGSCLLADGHAKEACELIADVIDRADSARTAQSFMPSWLSDLSLALLAEGELDRAAETAERALQQGLADGAPSRVLESRIASARVRLAAPADDPTFEDDVEDHLRLALELVEQMDFEELRPSLHELRAQLFAKRGDDAGRRRELAEAQHLYAEMGAPLRAEALARQLSA